MLEATNKSLVHMVGRPGIMYDRKTNIVRLYKGEDVVANHDHSPHELTSHIDRSSLNSIFCLQKKY